MERRQQGVLELFTRVHAFLTANPTAGEAGTLDTAVASLGEVIDRLRSQQATQAAIERAQREQTVIYRQRARRLQVGLMRPIARMAQVLYPGDDAVQQALFVPTSLRTEVLASAATSIAETLAPRVEQFAAAGLAQDVLTKLVDAADELRAMTTTRALERARRVATTEAIRYEVQQGLLILRLLDALVLLPLEANLAQRAEWKALMRRAYRPAEGSATPSPAAPTTPSPVVTPVPAAVPAAVQLPEVGSRTDTNGGLPIPGEVNERQAA